MYSKKDLKKTTFFIFFILLLFPSMALAMDVTLTWDPSLDGDVAEYRLYVREEIEQYTIHEWEGTDTTGTIYGLDEYEAYFFVVRAVDFYGNESDNSNEVYIAANYDNDHQLDPGTGGSSDGSDSGHVVTTAGGGGGGGGGGCFISSFR